MSHNVNRQLSAAGAHDSGYAEDASKPSVDDFDRAFDKSYKPPRPLNHRVKIALQDAHRATTDSLISGSGDYGDRVREAKALSTQAHASVARESDPYLDVDEAERSETPQTREDKLDRLAELRRSLANLESVPTPAAPAPPSAPPAPVPAQAQAPVPAQAPAAPHIDARPGAGFEGDTLTSLADLDQALGLAQPTPTPAPRLEPQIVEVAAEPTVRLRDRVLPETVALIRAAINEIDPDLAELSTFSPDELALCRCDLQIEVLCTFCASLARYGAPYPAGRHIMPPKKKTAKKKAASTSFAHRATAPVETTDHGTPMVIVECSKLALGMRSNAKFDLDPSASRVHETVPAKRKCYGVDSDDVDGTSIEWAGKGSKPIKIYNNPPYGREIPKWTGKAVEAMGDETAVIVQLLPMRGAEWFLDDILPFASAVCFVRGRLTFEGSDDPYMVDSIVVLWGDEHIATFTHAFGVHIPKEKVKRKLKRKGQPDEIGWVPLKRPIGRVLNLCAVRDAMT